MKISELIATLQNAQKTYGDHPVTTFDGFVRDVRIFVAKDGILHPIKRGTHNEISLEVISE